MKRVVVMFAIVVLGAVAPSHALGKGASEATISGPGLGDPISLAGEGQPGGEALMRIADEAGFFPAVFVRSPDPMLDERPAGVLGPKYTVTYVMPGPNNEEDRLVQDLYPYAEPSPVAYVAPGQRFWTTERTHGGWFLATSSLKDRLVLAGLPRNTPSTDTHSGPPWRVVGPLMALVGVAALAVVGALLIRRRPQPA
jgi:hypothetical protein